MGREAPALCRWKDETGQVTALLESTEIILRGGIRARIPRATLTAIEAAGGTLGLQSGDGALTLDLGHDEAEKWAAILRKPPPTLAQKLGISEGALVFVIGALTDDALAAALDGATTPMIGRAAMLVAELHTQRDPTDALTVARGNEAAPLWAIHEKGPLAGLRDSDIRAALRAQAYVDTKSTAVSTAMTATLYRPKRG